MSFMEFPKLYLTHHILNQLKYRGIIPFHFTVRDAVEYIIPKITQENIVPRSKDKYVLNNNSVVVVVDNKVITGYWDRKYLRCGFNKCR